MTILPNFPMKCSVCDRVSGHTILGSWHTMWPYFGPELDTRSRPGFVLDQLIQACPHCGFCANHLAEVIDDAATIVASPAYQAQLKCTGFPELANKFLCWGMLQENAGDFSAAGRGRLYASWACDDRVFASDESMIGVVLQTLAFMLFLASLGWIRLRGRARGVRYNKQVLAAARRCRKAAVDLFQRAHEAGQSFASGPGEEDVLLVDLLRRSGDLEAALSRCRAGLARGPELKIKKVLEYELHLIQERDSDRHWLFEAMGQTREDIIQNRAAPRNTP
jgi:hypothetical protein